MADVVSTDFINKAFGLSQAQKAFHPWWDSLEDYLLYGLIMIGLMVMKTEMVTSTSLDCNYCQSEYNCTGYDGRSYRNQRPDPGYNIKWVKQFCTYESGAVDDLVLFYPYLLLTMGISLLLSQKLTARIFTSSRKMNMLYKFVAEVWSGNDDIEIDAINIKNSFQNSSGQYYGYLCQTLSLLALSSGFAIYIGAGGWMSFYKAEVVICKTHLDYYYECHGIPYFFYLCSFYVSSLMVCAFILLQIYNLAWICFPQLSLLSRVMTTYKENMRSATTEQAGVSDRELLGELHDIYYNNRDLALLLNLLASSSGVAESLVIMTVLDEKFKENLKPEIESASRTVEDGKAEIKLKKVVSGVKYELTGISGVNLMHVAQISPSTEHTVQIIEEDETEDEEEKAEERVEISKRQRTKRWLPLLNRRRSVDSDVTFKGLKSNEKYEVTISTIINGKKIHSVTVALTDKALSDSEQGT